MWVGAARDHVARLYYAADPMHPLYPPLRELVLRTTGMYGVLQENLAAPTGRSETGAEHQQRSRNHDAEHGQDAEANVATTGTKGNQHCQE